MGKRRRNRRRGNKMGKKIKGREMMMRNKEICH